MLYPKDIDIDLLIMIVGKFLKKKEKNFFVDTSIIFKKFLEIFLIHFPEKLHLVEEIYSFIIENMEKHNLFIYRNSREFDVRYFVVKRYRQSKSSFTIKELLGNLIEYFERYYAASQFKLLKNEISKQAGI